MDSSVTHTTSNGGENAQEMSEINSAESSMLSEGCSGHSLPPDIRVKTELNTSIEEIFSDPRSFDFLLSIESSNLVRDLRKESLYVKFDPYVPTPTKEIPDVSKLAESTDARLLVQSGGVEPARVPDEAPPVPWAREGERASRSRLQLSFPRQDAPFPAPDVVEKEEFDESLVKKKFVLHLRNLIVRRESEYSEKLEIKKKALQQMLSHLESKKNPTKLKVETPSLDIIIKEYEDFVKVLEIDKKRSAIGYQEMKNNLLKEIESTEEEINVTRKAYENMKKKGDELRRDIDLLSDDICLITKEIEKIRGYCEVQEKNIREKDFESLKELERLHLEIHELKSKLSEECRKPLRYIQVLESQEEAMKKELIKLEQKRSTYVAYLKL